MLQGWSSQYHRVHILVQDSLQEWTRNALWGSKIAIKWKHKDEVLKSNKDNRWPHCTNLSQVDSQTVIEIFNIFNSKADGLLNKEEFDVCWNNWIKKILKPRSALIVVDVQNDFISGSLAISNCPAGHNGEDVVAPINHMLDKIPFTMICYRWRQEQHHLIVIVIVKLILQSASTGIPRTMFPLTTMLTFGKLQLKAKFRYLRKREIRKSEGFFIHLCFAGPQQY